jgi:hypothetical protein
LIWLPQPGEGHTLGTARRAQRPSTALTAKKAKPSAKLSSTFGSLAPPFFFAISPRRPTLGYSPEARYPSSVNNLPRERIMNGILEITRTSHLFG